MSDSELDWGDDDVGENEQGGEDDWGDMVEFDAADAAAEEEKAEELRLALTTAVASIPPLPGQHLAEQLQYQEDRLCGGWNIIEDYRPPAALRGLCEAK